MFSVDVLTQSAGAVAPATLADRLGVDATDPMLPALCVAATNTAREYLRRAVVPTQIQLNLESWPVIGAVGAWVSGNRAQLATWVELPYTGPLIAIDSVTDSDGQPVTDYQVSQGNPARYSMTARQAPLTITYTTGWRVTPPDIIEAILMIAAYMYEHRGQCATGNIVAESGAAWLLSTYRIEI